MEVLFLDFFGAYLPHFVAHKVKPLWMVHLVHHTDHKVDTTTANRHHPLESMIRFSFTLLGVFVVDTPIAIIMLYQSMSLVFTQFTHANLKMPKGVVKTTVSEVSGAYEYERFIDVIPAKAGIHFSFLFSRE